MSGDLASLLQARLAVLQPQSVELVDESHLHVGHAGAKGGAHFRLTIVSSAFSGKNTVARHRLVYDAVGDLMRGPVHALVIRAISPEEH